MANKSASIRSRMPPCPGRSVPESLTPAARLRATLDGGPFDGKKVISRMSSTHTAQFEPGNVHAFAVTENQMKFFDKQTGRRTARIPLK
jgi:hypothetical protein